MTEIVSLNFLKRPLSSVSSDWEEYDCKEKLAAPKPDPSVKLISLLEKYSMILPYVKHMKCGGAQLFLSKPNYTHDPFVILMSVLEFLYHKKFREVKVYAPCKFSLYFDAFFELISTVSSVWNMGSLELYVVLKNDKMSPFPITFISGEGILYVRIELPKTVLSIQYPCLHQNKFSWGAKALRCEIGVSKLLSYLVPEGIIRKFQYLGNTTLNLMASDNPTRESVFHFNRILLKIAREEASPPFRAVEIASSKQFSRSWMRLASGMYSRSVELSSFSKRVNQHSITFNVLGTNYFEEVRAYGRKVTDDVSVYSVKSYGIFSEYEEEDHTSASFKLSSVASTGLQKLKKVLERLYSW